MLERYIRTYFPSIVFCGILLVVAIELYDPSRLELEWTTITLIVLLLLAPYIRDLKALEVANVGSVTLQDDIESARRTVHRIGDDGEGAWTHGDGDGDGDSDSGPGGEESEGGTTGNARELVTSAVVRESTVRDRAGSSSQSGPAGDGVGDELNGIYETEYRLLDRNPRIALARLRTELDVATRSLLEEAAPERADRGCLDPTAVVDRLHDEGIVDGAFVAAYTEVRSLCNQAIHGEAVRQRDAIELVDLGLALIRIVESTRAVYSVGDDR
ncbi:hypothetical protein [Halomontanus rarus]|uniref:hypothetical protein n=1 Tax=Halomontanus rarus TaxID=3034020 RepID=UPI0023E83065|nr:hypothetical protein [Halovivax sp. TS33]